MFCFPRLSILRQLVFQTDSAPPVSSASSVSQGLPLSVSDILRPSGGPYSSGHYLEPHELDVLMSTAYSSTLILTPPIITLPSKWCSHWETITQLSGRHFDLPRGACRHRYIDLLCNEVNLLFRDSFPAEHIVIFSSVIL